MVKQRHRFFFFRRPCVLIGSKHENTRSPCIFIGLRMKDPVGMRDDSWQTHPNPQRPFRARVAQIYEIRQAFRARVVQIVEMNARQALTFLTVSRPKCATVLHFATLMSGKHYKTTISQPKSATLQRFCNIDVQKTPQNNEK